jgi:hypothetical protein
MKKQTIRLQGLLNASLFTLISNTHAQESVSSFEQSIINKNEAVIQTRPENVVAGTPANFDMKALKIELKTRGWDIQQKTDGSLILLHRKPSGNSLDKMADKNKASNHQWQQLQQKLQNAGWSAVLDTDGSMRLTPPNTVSATKSEEFSHAIKSIENEDNFFKGTFKNTQQKLKESGWHVTNNSDGSVLLYPPKNAVSKKIYSCPGIKPVVEVLLPVDSWQEAHDIAQGWLNDEIIPHSSVGKIREIFNVYIISIVSSETPFVLKHQIAIRKSNGVVIVLN